MGWFTRRLDAEVAVLTQRVGDLEIVVGRWLTDTESIAHDSARTLQRLQRQTQPPPEDDEDTSG